jgi:tRNA(Ile)-lysidine synthase
LARGQHVLVGCSGGPDSQALLHGMAAIASELQIRVEAASVNHGLRPNAADDVAVAGKLASQLGVPFHALSVQVPGGSSRQAQARQARYGALFALAEARGAQRVAVGHTLDDQAETVLARILRGTGVLGLSAISPQRADGLIRPLIDLPRQDVHAYVQALGIPHVTDASNADLRYTRVRIRRGLLPAMAQENPRIAAHFSALADDAAGATVLLTAVADDLLATCSGNVGPLRGRAPYVQRLVLQRWCERQCGLRPSRSQLMALAQLVEQPGEVRLSGDLAIKVDADGTLCIAKSSKRGRGRARQTPQDSGP